MEFWVNSGCFLRLSPQDGVRIISNHPDFLNYFRMHNLPESCVQIGRIVFELAKENVAIWQKYRFCHPIGQMDLSCPQTIRSEICQKCRETISLVQVCFRFEISLTVLKLLSKIWVNLWNFEEILAVFAFFFARWSQNNFKTIGLFKLH